MSADDQAAREAVVAAEADPQIADGSAPYRPDEAGLVNLLATAREIADEDARYPENDPCCGSCESAPDLAREVLRLHEPDDATRARLIAACKPTVSKLMDDGCMSFMMRSAEEIADAALTALTGAPDA